MQQFMQTLVLSATCALGAGHVLQAQSATPVERGPTAFASENAILDTAIPFAIGAREARQALRGAFGWPSFQEGLVEGVYFRFDPDGYARFAPTPRLDVDVFEVICRPRTYACAGRKGGLEVFLTDRGQLQIKLDQATAGDMFFVSEGVSEIQVPERILQPLDVQLELLLGSGGDLIVRRGGAEVVRVSLKGFSAVTAYLRWIAARQDYAVLPRGWPVPNAQRSDPSATMTQPSAWNSPMPQPQVVAPGYASALATGIAPATTAAPLTMQATAPQPMAAAAPTEPEALFSQANSADALRAEIETLKHLILKQQHSGDMEVAIGETNLTSGRGVSAADTEHALGFEQVLEAVDRLQDQLEMLQPAYPTPVEVPRLGDVDAVAKYSSGVETAPWVGAASSSMSLQALEGTPLPVDVRPEAASQMGEGAKLAYLIEELGLDPKTALSVLAVSVQRQGERDDSEMSPPMGVVRPAEMTRADAQPVLYKNNLVDQILSELEEDLSPVEAETAAPPVRVDDYVLLSRYFKSAGLPLLQSDAAMAAGDFKN